jgi:Peptide N-acetyl-beta-D-glucosaminyl asparaginase amidase A
MPRSLAARCALLACLLSLLSGTAQADPPVPGARGAVVADPVIPPLRGTPCVARLYTDEVFSDFSLHDFDYAPPSGCAGPFARIVLRADFSVTTGRQFDRTANIWLGAVNLYFGTTQEPSATVAPVWRIERDISDYASLLRNAQRGKIDLGNVVNDTYTGILHGSAQILFYPADPDWPDMPRRPDRVLAMAAGELGGSADVVGNGEFSRTITFPRNIERIFLDVVAQSQAGDEFWMTCVPDEFAEALQSCGHTAFRQTQVRIDGQPAGMAPVSPWLYTGAIDPGAWRPIPAVQTLSFEPWRVDLSPFAARLNDGLPHTVALSVFNVGERFSVAANLLLYLDAGREVVGGALTDNTLDRDPPVDIDHATSTQDGVARTTLSVASRRSYLLSGYVDTSRGRVTTTVIQDIDFSNRQQFEISDDRYVQRITQDTTVWTESRVAEGARNQVIKDTRRFPLTLDYHYETLDAGARQQLAVTQQFEREVEASTAGFPPRRASLSNRIANGGELLIAADGALALRTAQYGAQRYQYRDAFGNCYSRRLAAEAGAISTVNDGEDCAGGRNFLPAFDAFYNYASHVFGATVQVRP